mmetsp:Transcript_612/g.1940  ORF Transcript_612/g.1940 Transcript_612/m.1940 type:complete len:806 (+) Transcript_612:696-3113(+)
MEVHEPASCKELEVEEKRGAVEPGRQEEEGAGTGDEEDVASPDWDLESGLQDCGTMVVLLFEDYAVLSIAFGIVCFVVYLWPSGIASPLDEAETIQSPTPVAPSPQRQGMPAQSPKLDVMPPAPIFQVAAALEREECEMEVDSVADGKLVSTAVPAVEEGLLPEDQDVDMIADKTPPPCLINTPFSKLLSTAGASSTPRTWSATSLLHVEVNGTPSPCSNSAALVGPCVATPIGTAQDNEMKTDVTQGLCATPLGKLASSPMDTATPLPTSRVEEVVHLAQPHSSFLAGNLSPMVTAARLPEAEDQSAACDVDMSSPQLPSASGEQGHEAQDVTPPPPPPALTCAPVDQLVQIRPATQLRKAQAIRFAHARDVLPSPLPSPPMGHLHPSTGGPPAQDSDEQVDVTPPPRLSNRPAQLLTTPIERVTQLLGGTKASDVPARPELSSASAGLLPAGAEVQHVQDSEKTVPPPSDRTVGTVVAASIHTEARRSEGQAYDALPPQLPGTPLGELPPTPQALDAQDCEKKMEVTPPASASSTPAGKPVPSDRATERYKAWVAPLSESVQLPEAQAQEPQEASPALPPRTPADKLHTVSRAEVPEVQDSGTEVTRWPGLSSSPLGKWVPTPMGTARQPPAAEDGGMKRAPPPSLSSVSVDTWMLSPIASEAEQLHEDSNAKTDATPALSFPSTHVGNLMLTPIATQLPEVQDIAKENVIVKMSGKRVSDTVLTESETKTARLETSPSKAADRGAASEADLSIPEALVVQPEAQDPLAPRQPALMVYTRTARRFEYPFAFDAALQYGHSKRR